jgi:hypothetical protein
MAQHCAACGRELRDTDEFCGGCGTPTSGAAPQPPLPQRWESCEITWSKKKGFWAKWYFWARNLETGAPVVTGSKEFVPQGNSYGASQPEAGIPGTVPAFDEVVQSLVAAGWEPLAPSSASTSRWNQRYRRAVKN